MDLLANILRNNSDIRENFQEHFEKYEVELVKSSFHKVEHYFIEHHYDASKKSKRRWGCSFSNNDIIAIQIDDPHYKTDKRFVRFIRQSRQPKG
jgi:hypothetical protein